MAKRSSKRKRTSKNIPGLSKKILKVLRNHPNQTFNYKQLADVLDITNANGRNQIIKKLATLVKSKQIAQAERGKFKINEEVNYYEGVLDMTTRKDGYVIVEELEEDVYIPQKNINKAFDGDRVKIYVYRKRTNKKNEGEVVEVIERKKLNFVGILHLNDKFGFVEIQNPKMYTDIFVPKDKLPKEAKNGLVVTVKFEKWDDKDSPTGSVMEVLGEPGSHETEMQTILIENGLPHDFPKEVEEFANQLDTSIQEKEIKKRRDMRDTLTFTIDPKDAKDFDDALSFKILENGNYEIGIHIADVSHYVEPGTILDDEAYERGTSIYLVDRVVPMLPEVLSNNACSLRPHEEKYTFSAVFEINKKAEVVKNWFGRTVTYSDARFAYEEAQHIIETKKGSIPNEISLTGKLYDTTPEIVEAVLTLDSLAKKMRAKRMSSGAISFDKVEVKFNLDEHNDPIGVYFKTSQDANKLIEEFMLLANKKVSEFIGKQEPQKTFVYRCHDEPNDDKLAALENVVGKFGYKLNLKDRKSVSRSLNGLLKDVQGKKEQNMVDTLTIRTMSKAYYSTNNIGHYGLAFDYYSHFTSPIRRYPDVMAHRLLQRYIDGKNSANEEEYEGRCNHCSDMEMFATNAERDSIKYMQVKFMQDHQNEQFLGVISGVTEWGIYVEIEQNKCEGMVRLRDIKEDHFEFDQENFAIVGKKTKKVYQLGDEVYVTVKNADLVKRHLDFNLVGARQEVEV
ncbi:MULTISPECIES: ribonuclease R [Mesonia]|uniref:Ribonuclease R n=1 Tax=Mesonia oceanica TaxID=2687242 RepID=A0AC61Y2X6_9FLAO|nr:MULTISPECIES: ribonuclease R [Mesonia]MAN28563.1 ribonuclease R [Mesonia sp.]MAQ41244.1 ribonuclease R [Mesonia sp.]MBJ97343.1 ribonuclease R [Flavobacteriaceae bacterium]VVU98818.1 Ribonuclease R [Mesonia oceanica]|tara:strand:+ start:27211 stop:29415 length:2205 start_codon:yes stop_codon:yes gene_type:complete